VRALISTYDKTGLDTFARGLARLGWSLVASGGTAAYLEQLGLPVEHVEALTESPEMLGGRVKTLHPRIHAGILARRDNPEDVSTLAEQGIEPFDLVCVNLYPFASVSGRHDKTEDEIVELIDVGGPSMLRAAAKSARTPDEPGESGSGTLDEYVVAEVRHILGGIGLTIQPPAGRGAARDRWESLAALAQLAEDHCAASPGAGLADVVAELARRAAADRAPQVEGVTVASLHAAKGLEWDVVFLPGLTEGNLPIVHADGDEAVAEERRLLYVGVTRARQQVLLSWPLARLPGGRRNRTPSRFLDGLRPGWRQARAARAKPAASHYQFADADPALVEALREWRRGVARDAGVPAYVVFGDETLRNIAAQRPDSIAGLTRIPGFGPGRLDRYGAAVLALCATAPPRTGAGEKEAADEKKAGSRA